MSKEITMPKLSDTMTEGRLVSWKKSVGERIKRGDIIAEVETDKANMELEAFHSGTLMATRVKPGEMVQVGTVIAIIGDESEEPPPLKEEPAEKEEKSAKDEERAEVKKTAEEERTEESDSKEKEGEESVIKLEPVEGTEGKETEKASPLVRRLARERGIDLKEITGSGPDGRILREDIESALKKKEPGKEGVVKEISSESQAEPYREPSHLETRPLSRIRSAITKTVTKSWQEVPHFTVTIAIDMGETEEVRRELKESGTALTVNDLIVKATAIALQKYPLANNSFAGDRIKVNPDINIGLVVSLEEGLLVPVIKKCKGLTLKEIGNRSRELIELALSGKITEEEISGGTFTISNMGMFGVMEFKALIFPPQGAILAVGAVLDEATVKNGVVCVGRIMRVTLSADHRLMDGAYAARFLNELKRVLENPVAMLV